MSDVEQSPPAASVPQTTRPSLWLTLGAIWLLLALAVGYSGVLTNLPRPVLQAILFALTAVLLIAYFAVASFRSVVNGLPLRALIALHLTRFVGFYFLYLHSLGRLPYDFAVLGGKGDIMIASGAALLLLTPATSIAWRRGVFFWNLLGLVDILFVVSAAVRAGLSDPPSMLELTHLPLSLLATFLVPLIIASHIILFARLRRPADRDSSG